MKHSPSRFRLLSIEMPQSSKEKPFWKDTLYAVSRGWFYEFFDKALDSDRRCPMAFLSSDVQDWTRVIVEHAKSKLDESGLAEFRNHVGADVLDLPRDALAEEFPWEVSLLDAYRVALKNALLQAATDIQQCLGSSKDPNVVAASQDGYTWILSELQRRIPRRCLPKDVYDANVVPFIKLLKQVTGGG